MTQEIERQNEEIITLLGKYPEGLSRGQISEYLSFSINDKTLQRRLTALAKGRIQKFKLILAFRTEYIGRIVL